MMGGFLGQLLRGRARIPRWMRCGCGAAAAWLGFALMFGVAAGQEVPQAPTPSGTQGATPGLAGAGATPSQGQQTKPVDEKTDISQDAGLTTSVWQWKGLGVEKILFEGVTFDAADTLPKELC